jgi:hypothetical protein
MRTELVLALKTYNLQLPQGHTRCPYVESKVCDCKKAEAKVTVVGLPFFSKPNALLGFATLPPQDDASHLSTASVPGGVVVVAATPGGSSSSGGGTLAAGKGVRDVLAAAPKIVDRSGGMVDGGVADPMIIDAPVGHKHGLIGGNAFSEEAGEGGAGATEAEAAAAASAAAATTPPPTPAATPPPTPAATPPPTPAAPTATPTATAGGAAAAAAASVAAREAASAAAEPREGKTIAHGVQSKETVFFGPPVVVLRGVNPAVINIRMSEASLITWYADPGAACLDPEFGALPASQHPLHVSGAEDLKNTLTQIQKVKDGMTKWDGSGSRAAAVMVALSKLQYRRRHELVYRCVNKRGAESAPVKRAVVIVVEDEHHPHRTRTAAGGAVKKAGWEEALLLKAKRPAIELKGATPMLVLQSTVAKLEMELAIKENGVDASGEDGEVWRKLDPGARCIDPLEGELAGRVGMDVPGSLTLGSHTVVYTCSNAEGITALPVERMVVVVTAFTTPMIFIAGPNPLALPSGIPLPLVRRKGARNTGTLAHPPVGYTKVEDPGVKCVDATDGDITTEALRIHIRRMPKGVGAMNDPHVAVSAGGLDGEHVGVYAGKGHAGTMSAGGSGTAGAEASEQVAQIEYTCSNRRGGEAVPQVRLVMVANGLGEGDAFSTGVGGGHGKFAAPAHMASWLKVLEHEEELEQRRQENDASKAHSNKEVWDPRPRIEVLGPNPLVIDPKTYGMGQLFVDPGAACVDFEAGALQVEATWSGGVDLQSHPGRDSNLKQGQLGESEALSDGVHIVEYTCKSKDDVPAIPKIRRVVLLKGAAAAMSAGGGSAYAGTANQRPVIYLPTADVSDNAAASRLDTMHWQHGGGRSIATSPIVVSESILKKYPALIGDLANDAHCVDTAAASAAAAANAVAVKAGVKLPVHVGAQLPVKVIMPKALKYNSRSPAPPPVGSFQIQYECEGLFKAKSVNRTVEVLSPAEWAIRRVAHKAHQKRGKLVKAAKLRQCSNCVGLVGPCRKERLLMRLLDGLKHFDCTFFEKQKLGNKKGDAVGGEGDDKEVCPSGWERCKQHNQPHYDTEVISHLATHKVMRGGTMKEDDDADVVTSAPHDVEIGDTAVRVSGKCTADVELACARQGRPLAEPLPPGDLRGALVEAALTRTHKASCSECVKGYIWTTPPPTPSITWDEDVSEVAASLAKVEHRACHAEIRSRSGCVQPYGEQPPKDNDDTPYNTGKMYECLNCMVKHVERMQLGLVDHTKCTMPAIYAFCGLEEKVAPTTLREDEANGGISSGAKGCDAALKEDTKTGRCFTESKKFLGLLASEKEKNPTLDSNYKCLACVEKQLYAIGLKQLKSEKKGVISSSGLSPASRIVSEEELQGLNFADLECSQLQLLRVCGMYPVTTPPPPPPPICTDTELDAFCANYYTSAKKGRHDSSGSQGDLPAPLRPLPSAKLPGWMQNKKHTLSGELEHVEEALPLIVEYSTSILLGRSPWVRPRPGEDANTWYNPHRDTPSLHRCADECLHDPKCVAGTFMTAGYRRGECWLAGSLSSPPESAADVVAGNGAGQAGGGRAEGASGGVVGGTRRPCGAPCVSFKKRLPQSMGWAKARSRLESGAAEKEGLAVTRAELKKGIGGAAATAMGQKEANIVWGAYAAIALRHDQTQKGAGGVGQSVMNAMEKARVDNWSWPKIFIRGPTPDHTPIATVGAQFTGIYTCHAPI